MRNLRGSPTLARPSWTRSPARAPADRSGVSRASSGLGDAESPGGDPPRGGLGRDLLALGEIEDARQRAGDALDLPLGLLARPAERLDAGDRDRAARVDDEIGRVQ